MKTIDYMGYNGVLDADEKVQMKLSYFPPCFKKDVNDTFQCFNLLCDWRKGEHPSFKMHNQILFHISV